MLQSTPDLTVAVLAGGQSNRFGTEKAEAEFRGKKLIDHAVAIARDISTSLMIITHEHQSFKPDDLPVHNDITPGLGPVGGLYTALHHSETEWTAIMPVDMPFLNKHVYQILMESIEPSKPAVAVSNGNLHPLVSIWPAILIGGIKNCIHTNQLSMRGLLKSANAVFIEMGDQCGENTFTNINYASDLATIKAGDHE